MEEKLKTVLRVGRQARKSAVDTDDASETSTGPEDDYNQYEDLFTAVCITFQIWQKMSRNILMKWNSILKLIFWSYFVFR